MAEPAAPPPTKVELALLADVAAGRVADDLDGTVWLTLDDEDEGANVSTAVWEMERAPRRWVHQLDGEKCWRLTYRGRDVLQGRAPDA